MEVLRMMEEMRYPSEILKIDTSRVKPSILQSTLMEEECRGLQEEDSYVFVDFARIEATYYLLIYIWNSDTDYKTKQLVCTSGCRLSEADEELLVSVCLDPHAQVNEYLLSSIVELYDLVIPHTNIKLYEDKPLLTVLHMYACLHRGIRELLFKAQLPYLAGALDTIDGINLLPVLTKGAPVDLFEKGFTNRLLKLLNSEWGVQELLTEEKRRVTLAVYKAFNSKLGGCSQISQSQWCYLKACCQDSGKFNMSLFHFFRYGKSDELYEDYVTLLAKRRIVNCSIRKAWKNSFKTPVDFEGIMRETDYLLSYVMCRDEYDASLRRQSSRMKYLDFSDSEYVISHPHTVRDIFREGVSQHNCLMTMFKEICRGEHDIGFMRTSNNPESSMITFEVKNGNEICEFRGQCNRLFAPTSDELAWFVNEYMKQKGFHFSDSYKYFYTREFYSEDYIWRDGLMDMLYWENEDIPF